MTETTERPARRDSGLRAENSRLRALVARVEAERLPSGAAEAAYQRGLSDARQHAAAEAGQHAEHIAAAQALNAELARLNAELRLNEAFTQRLLASSSDAIQVLSLEGAIVSASEGSRSGFGSLAASRGRPWAELWGTEQRAEAASAVATAAADGVGRCLGARAGADGTLRWWDAAITPIHDEAGRPERLLAISRDVTAVRAAEDRQRLLMQELSHRMKNSLAMVQAIAAQTLIGPGLRDARDAFAIRLQALAQAHDILLQGAWESASVAALVASVATLHAPDDPGRLDAQGPPVTIGSKPALALALVLHEMATNAAKYGALSVPGGRVTLRWAVAPTHDGARLVLDWTEAGGPPVRPPAREGFGTRLIARSLGHAFGGTADLTFPPDGVRLHLAMPLAEDWRPPAQGG
jgi:PAS domain S-box-containing protein